LPPSWQSRIQTPGPLNTPYTPRGHNPYLTTTPLPPLMDSGYGNPPMNMPMTSGVPFSTSAIPVQQVFPRVMFSKCSILFLPFFSLFSFFFLKNKILLDLSAIIMKNISTKKRKTKALITQLILHQPFLLPIRYV